MLVLLIPLLVGCGTGCSGEPPAPSEPLPESFVDPRIDETDAAPALQLYRMEGRYDLPPTNLPPGISAQTRMPVQLTKGRSGVSKRSARTYVGELPFDVGMEGRRFAPSGMTIEVGGEEIPYAKGGKHWNVRDNVLTVTWPTTPPGPATVTWSQLAEEMTRHTFSEAGLPGGIDFCRYQLSIKDETRDGMLIPAPGKVEWEVELPASGASFETWLALEQATIITNKSDGATAVMHVIDASGEHEVGRQRLAGPHSSGFQPFRVNLDKYKGKKVTVRLSTEPGRNNYFDYVFFGSPTISGPTGGEVRHVIVIGMDTTRPDHFGWAGYDKPTSPEFDIIANQSVIFDQAWTPAPRTRPSFRTATTGRYPLDAVGAKNIGEVFQEHGFATSAFVANIHLQPKFGFNTGFEEWTYTGGARANEQVDSALAWLDRNRNRDTYTFLHIMDPHVFYDPPAEFIAKFVTDPDPDLKPRMNRGEVIRQGKMGTLTDQRKAHLEGLYDGELAFTSRELGRFFAELDKMGGRTLVFVHSDHGEEFWEHGKYEHNHSLYNETTKAVLLLRSNRGMATPKRIETPATLADMAPTLYDFAKFEDAPETDGKSLRPLIDGTAGDDKSWKRPLGVAHMRYGHERWGVVWNKHKYIIHTKDGLQELYDLSKDPGEHNDLAKKTDLRPYHKALHEAHNMPVGQGWRIEVSAGQYSDPLVFKLPQKAAAAGVIDPERTIEAPNNQAWGEPPKRHPSEIGTAELHDGGMTFVWTPGSNPVGGLLYVLFGNDVSAEALVVTRGMEEATLEIKKDGKSWRKGHEKFTIKPGIVFIPPEGEASRMRRLGMDGSASAAELELLIELDYVDEEDDEDDEVEGANPDEDIDEQKEDEEKKQ